MPHYAKAELIEGTVTWHLPCVLNPMPNHTAISSVYGAKLPRRREISDNPTVRLDLDNEPQPRFLLIDAGWWTVLSGEDGYIEGARTGCRNCCVPH